MPPLQLIFGGASWKDAASNPLPALHQSLNILSAHKVHAIDTSARYGDSEVLLGQINAASRFTIHTKYPGGASPEPSTTTNVIETLHTSLTKLHTEQVDIFYIHAPDRRVPLDTLLAGIHALHQAGKFRRFGLSNFLPDEVDAVVRLATEKGYVLPSVYQGSYNAVARRAEAELLPTLRKYGIAFYAYSPIAGGFLTKDVERLVAGEEGGRWAAQSPYNALYNRPGMREGLQVWGEIARQAGVPKAELAYRWIVYHSVLKPELGDGVIFGASSNEQLEQTLVGVENGPLVPEIVKRIDEVWDLVHADAVLDPFNSQVSSQGKAAA